MEHYLHRVLGIYETRVEAQAARDRLVERGLAPDKVKVFASLRQSDREALSAANLSLFVASPLLAPLTMLGWGASAGAIVGGAAGAQRNKGDVSDLVKDALSKRRLRSRQGRAIQGSRDPARSHDKRGSDDGRARSHRRVDGRIEPCAGRRGRLTSWLHSSTR